MTTYHILTKTDVAALRQCDKSVSTILRWILR